MSGNELCFIDGAFVENVFSFVPSDFSLKRDGVGEGGFQERKP